MKKDLLKLIVTASVATLLIGCGSSGKSTNPAPTVAPTATANPTVAPTVAPTATPTVAPTATPSPNDINDTSDPLPF